ncbi:MAG: YdcH family protein [Gammaproteobacteria bacterium]
MYKEYDTLDLEILEIEQNIEAVSDFYAEDLKKKRMVLKDKLYEMLSNQSAIRKAGCGS